MNWNLLIGMLLGAMVMGSFTYAEHEYSGYSPSREFGRGLDTEQTNRNQQRLYVDPLPGPAPLVRPPC